MDTDRNLLFGVLALQADLIDTAQFAEACAAWATRKDTPLSNLLVERGWLTPADQADVERLLERKLRKHGGDARASLAAITGPEVRQSLAAVEDADVQRTVSSLAPVGSQTSLPIPTVPLTRDRYTLVRLHGAGGLGRVWQARDGNLDRDVALKELHDKIAADPGFRTRFLQEARITGHLEHPNIVPVYELAHRPENQQPFYTMRFIQGRTLSEATAAFHRQRPEGSAAALELRALLNAFVAVCQAVAYAHSRNVIHRDLKGGNIVLGDFGEVIVLDWGLAKVLNGAAEAAPAGPAATDEAVMLTKQGDPVGTPAYMPPEQAAGQLDRIDQRSDVYGLGAILYEVLTGRPPMAGGSVDEVLLRVQREEPERPRQLWTGVPLALEAVCLRALAKRPEERYASARELAEDVQRWLADEPVTAWREPWTIRARRWVARHRTGVMAGVAGVTVASICLAIATVLLTAAYREVEQQRSQVEVQRDKARDNFKLARAAVDKYHTKVSESPELKAHGLETLRRQLLESAVEFYEEFVRKQDSHDVQTNRGLAFLRLADIYRDTGKYNEAEQACMEAFDSIRQLQKLQPEEPESQRWLAACWDSLAQVYLSTKRHEEAKKAFLEAITHTKNLSKFQSQEPHTLWQLGRAHVNVGMIHRVNGNDDLAETAFRDALAILEPLVSAHPNTMLYERLLANCHGNLGLLHDRRRNFKAAEKSFQDALTISEPLARSYSRVPALQDDVATFSSNLGKLYNAQGRHDEAAEALQKASATLRRLHGTHPEIVRYAIILGSTSADLGTTLAIAGRYPQALEAASEAIQLAGVVRDKTPKAPAPDFLRYALRTRAEAFSRLGRHVEAEADWESAFPLVPERMLSGWQLVRAVTQARKGDHVKAMAKATETEKESQLHTEVLLALARIYSLCSYSVSQDDQLSLAERNLRAKTYQARALELLNRASAAGYFKTPAGARDLREDKDLDPLRSRPDFQKLLAELEKKTKKSDQ